MSVERNNSVNVEMIDKQKYIRVTGVRNERYTEFEFSIDDPKLFVELILPFKEFKEFCDEHKVKKLTVEQSAAVDFDQLKWRYGDVSLNKEN